MNVFVDTWAWLALALQRDQHHAAAKRQHAAFLGAGRVYLTSDYVLGELITQLYRMLDVKKSEAFIMAVLAAIDSGNYRLERISAERFSAAWQLRLQYADKPVISFVDFTSMVVMRELGIEDVFSGDADFAQVNMGFRVFPQE